MKLRGFSTLVAVVAASITFVTISTPDSEAQDAPAKKKGLSGVKVKVDVKKPKIEKQTTPEFNVGRVTDKRAKYKDWLEIDVEFKVETSAGKKLLYIPDLTFKYYVYFADKPKLPNAQQPLLTGTVEHVNIEVDEEVWSSVYISPRSIKTILNNDTMVIGPNIIFAVGVEVSYAGKVVGGATTKGKFDPAGKKNWWNNPKLKATPVPDHLASKPDTPFSVLWYDRYAEVKKK